MSHYKVRYLSVRNQTASITVADSSARPLHYVKLDQTERLKKMGEKEFLKETIVDFRNGNLHFSSYQGILGKIYEGINLLKKNELDYFLADNEYSELVYNHVHGISNDVEMYSLLKDQEGYLKYTLNECAGRWSYIPLKWQENEDFAKWYVEQCSKKSFFQLPKVLAGRKDILLNLVKERGVFLRQIERISPEYLNDKDIVKAAFSSIDFPEHLPDIIGEKLRKDVSFMIQIIEICPALHWERMDTNLLSESKILQALSENNQWYKKNNSVA